MQTLTAISGLLSWGVLEQTSQKQTSVFMMCKSIKNRILCVIISETATRVSWRNRMSSVSSICTDIQTVWYVENWGWLVVASAVFWMNWFFFLCRKQKEHCVVYHLFVLAPLRGIKRLLNSVQTHTASPRRIFTPPTPLFTLMCGGNVLYLLFSSMFLRRFSSLAALDESRTSIFICSSVNVRTSVPILIRPVDGRAGAWTERAPWTERVLRGSPMRRVSKSLTEEQIIRYDFISLDESRSSLSWNIIWLNSD